MSNFDAFNSICQSQNKMYEPVLIKLFPTASVQTWSRTAKCNHGSKNVISAHLQIERKEIQLL